LGKGSWHGLGEKGGVGGGGGGGGRGEKRVHEHVLGGKRKGGGESLGNVLLKEEGKKARLGWGD